MIIFHGKAKVRILKIDREKNVSRIEITIHEGKTVLALHRSKIENLQVKDIKLGNWRYLKESEVDRLLKSAKCNLQK